MYIYNMFLFSFQFFNSILLDSYFMTKHISISLNKGDKRIYINQPTVA